MYISFDVKMNDLKEGAGDKKIIKEIFTTRKIEIYYGLAYSIQQGS